MRLKSPLVSRRARATCPASVTSFSPMLWAKSHAKPRAVACPIPCTPPADAAGAPASAVAAECVIRPGGPLGSREVRPVGRRVRGRLYHRPDDRLHSQPACPMVRRVLAALSGLGAVGAAALLLGWAAALAVSDRWVWSQYA